MENGIVWLLMSVHTHGNKVTEDIVCAFRNQGKAEDARDELNRDEAFDYPQDNERGEYIVVECVVK